MFQEIVMNSSPEQPKAEDFSRLLLTEISFLEIHLKSSISTIATDPASLLIQV